MTPEEMLARIAALELENQREREEKETFQALAEKAEERAEEAEKRAEEERRAKEEAVARELRKKWPPCVADFDKLLANTRSGSHVHTGRFAGSVSGSFHTEPLSFVPERCEGVFNGYMLDRKFYKSENDVTTIVNTFLTDIMRVMKLPATLTGECAAAELRPDFWVILNEFDIPIGVIEVKKPPKAGSPSPLDHEEVIGEVYDYVELLHHAWGVREAFAIITTMEEWRVVWRDDPESCALAARGEAPVPRDPPRTPPRNPNAGVVYASPISVVRTRRSRRIAERTPRSRADAEVFRDADGRERRLCVSEIVRVGTNVDLGDGFVGDAVIPFVASALSKMNSTTRTQPSDPFEVESSTRRFPVVMLAGGMYWATLSREGIASTEKRMTSFPSQNVKNLWLLEKLGTGRDGNAWLACTAGMTSTCVIKFRGEDETGSKAAKEAKNWEDVYGSKFPVSHGVWDGNGAVLMQYFSPAPEGERERRALLPLVRNALEEHFVNNGKKHMDIEWCNLGTYIDNDGAEKVVFFDLSDVVDENGRAWVDECIDLLKIGR